MMVALLRPSMVLLLLPQVFELLLLSAQPLDFPQPMQPFGLLHLQHEKREGRKVIGNALVIRPLDFILTSALLAAHLGQQLSLSCTLYLHCSFGHGCFLHSYVPSCK